MTHGKTYNKLPRRINHNATKSKTNTSILTFDFGVELFSHLSDFLLSESVGLFFQH